MEMLFPYFLNYLLEFKSNDEISIDILWAITYFDETILLKLCELNCEFIPILIEIIENDQPKYCLPALRLLGNISSNS